MKKILSWSKNQYGTAVVTKEDDGTFKRHDFPLGKSDAEIRAIIMGEPLPVAKAPQIEPPKRKPEKTIPEPPVVTKERITRQQMIAALDAAGVTDYDSRSRESLTMAFNAIKKGAM